MEVDHRANNVLALVEGIVRLSRTDSVERYAGAVRSRVQALGRAHALLAEHHWKYAPLDRLVREQVKPYGLRRVTLEGGPVKVAAELAQPLSLVVHELVANAAIHGALSVPRGSVAIHWRRNRNRDLTLAWTESGGPAPAAYRPPGFGSAIVRGVLERQLRGSVREEWQPEGLKVDLTIPGIVEATLG